MTRRAVATLSIALAVGMATPLCHALPSYQQVRQAYVPSDLTLLDRHGQPLPF